MLNTVSSDYVLIYLKSPAFILQGIPKMTGTAGQKRITRDYFAGNHFPLPPAAEQSRIVAKVDQLMALCNDLEAKQNQHAETHTQLIRAAHQPLTQAGDPAEFQVAWRRVRDHFDRLYTTFDSVKALRQTILQLAVQGKLVPQDPNDEPASMLLEKIKVEKEHLVAEGKIKKQKAFPPVEAVEMVFALPDTWVWSRMGNIVLSSESGWSPKAENMPADNDRWGVLKVSAVSWGSFREKENKVLPDYLEPRPQCEVHSGDFLISRANTAELVARSVVVEATRLKLMMSDKIIRIHFSELVNKYYINLFNGSLFARKYYSEKAGGTSSSMKNVSRQQIALMPVAIPPIEEQLQIIARVDCLMALCDELEAKIEAHQTTATQFSEAVVSDLAA
jgi:type I restriction enzyme S subunit